MPRSTLSLSILALVTSGTTAFIPSHTPLLCSSPSLTKHAAPSISDATIHTVWSNHKEVHSTISMNMMSSPLSQFLPSILTSYDETSPEEAFQDQVSLSDLTSDPSLQTAFAVSAIAIVLLFVAKAIVTNMDEAVQKTAMDFDRAMKLKYAKKWRMFMEEEEELTGVIDREERELDRIQKIVEEMERLQNEEPEFFERVMRDVERQI